MRRSLLIAASLIALPACLVYETGTGEPDRDPIRSACDADGDGALAPECGGDDCDDQDATVAPDADEWFGDDLDQDCDGTTEVQVDTFDLPVRTETLSLAWRPDLRGLGGVLVQPTGDVVAQNLDLDSRFGGPVVLKRRSSYAPPVGPVQALRLPHDGASLDLIADDEGLSAWRPDGIEGTRVWTRDAPAGHLDVQLTADDPDQAWLLACDAQRVRLSRLDLVDGREPEVASLDLSATSCALLGHRDGRPIVLIATPDGLERWILDDQGVLSDYLVLTRGIRGATVRTVGSKEDGVLAFVDGGVLTVLDPDGRGLRLGEGRASARFDLALSGDEVVVSWVDTEGLAWVGTGPIQGPIEPMPVIDGLVGEGPVIVGALDDELAVAIEDDDRLHLLRARR